MDNYFSCYAAITNTADLFINIGWCPDKVLVRSLTDGGGFEWYRLQGDACGFTLANAGDRALVSSAGVSLVQFTESSIDTSSDPSSVDPSNWIDANGIQLAAAMDFFADEEIVMIEAWRINYPWIRCVHDGTTSSNTYFEDGSFDFLELGVSSNGQWIIYNQTNGNYAYIKSITKPADSTKYCRLYTALSAGVDASATTAADFDTNDVCFVFPANCGIYPISDLTIMT
jgi:hypothetical protein